MPHNSLECIPPLLLNSVKLHTTPYKALSKLSGPCSRRTLPNSCQPQVGDNYSRSQRLGASTPFKHSIRNPSTSHPQSTTYLQSPAVAGRDVQTSEINAQATPYRNHGQRRGPCQFPTCRVQSLLGGAGFHVCFQSTPCRGA